METQQQQLKISAKENNQIKPEDRPVHEWFRFVLSFPPHLVRRYLTRFNVNKRQRVLDPFCGTGTTLVECKKLGIKCIGIEANPSVHFATETKLNWRIDPAGLLRHARKIAKLALARLHAEGIGDNGDLPLFGGRESNSLNFPLRSLPEESFRLLPKGAISPLPLHKTLVLNEILCEHSDGDFFQHERLALAKALVFEISNLHFGPEIGVRRIKKKDSQVVSAWLNCVTQMVKDLETLQDKCIAESEVICGDSRNIETLLRSQSIDAVITSPPYPNEKDYTRTTRLESVILGFLRDKADLRDLKQGLLRSNTRNVYKNDNDDLAVLHHAEIQRIAEKIEDKRIELEKTSGFERLYGRVTKLYFGGMHRHLSSLRSRLRPGAQLAYVVGDQASYLRVMIRTGELITDIAASLGYEVMGVDLFRTRLSTATRQQLREEVVLLKWPG